MSVVVTCNLSDGLVIGSDSAITIQGKVESPSGLSSGVLKIYNHSEKLFQLAKLPVAIATCGLGLLGERSIGSYVKEFEFGLIEEKDKQKVALDDLTVEQIAKRLRGFFLSKYDEVLAPLLEKELNLKYEEVPEEKKPVIELIVAGFSPKQYLSEIWHVIVPIKDSSAGLIRVRAKGEFGTNWFGHSDAIFRLIKGFDRNLPDQIISYIVTKNKISFTDEDKAVLRKILEPFEQKIPYPAMPIQDGVDHVKFLLDLVINQTKFVIGAEVCGGPIKIGVVQRGDEEFKILTDSNPKIT